MLNCLKRNIVNGVIGLLIISLIIGVISAVPIVLSQLIKQPYGHLTIGDDKSWVSFFGSYIGAIVGGLVAFGVARYQISKNDERYKKEQRSFLSASNSSFNFTNDEKIITRHKKNRIILTDDYKEMNAVEEDTSYYSIIRLGGNDVIWNCNFTITVSEDSTYQNTDKLKVWVDFFEKDEEIIIPLCSRKLSNLDPFVVELEVTYNTYENERIKFLQSEVNKFRRHSLIEGNREKLILEQAIQYTSWAQTTH